MAEKKRLGNRHLMRGLGLLYEDGALLVVDKPPGVLTMASDREDTRTVYYNLTNYVRKGNPKSRNRIFIVHRLDREASGILVFAKTEQVKEALQSNWEDVEKKYLVVVEGTFAEKSGTISSYLHESKAFIVYSTKDKSKGKLSRTAYTVLREARGLSLLEVTLLTGRKHQIRVHMVEAGHPIVGDRKYGPKARGKTRLALHAKSLAFTHPVTGQAICFETGVPLDIERLMA